MTEQNITTKERNKQYRINKRNQGWTAVYMFVPNKEIADLIKAYKRKLKAKYNHLWKNF